jgi:ABC-type dipeptide/oligopeptide/nickel transport system permease component|tara:strand:+ start:548 stop:670 length:123 start_codon:yes stop_codon:yes gene_type:complete
MTEGKGMVIFAIVLAVIVGLLAAYRLWSMFSKVSEGISIL